MYLFFILLRLNIKDVLFDRGRTSAEWAGLTDKTVPRKTRVKRCLRRVSLNGFRIPKDQFDRKHKRIEPKGGEICLPP